MGPGPANTEKGMVLPPPRRLRQIKISIVAGLVVVISSLHYFFYPLAPSVPHIFFREAYFAPLILAAFWFGLRGALITSLGISVLYLPYVLETRHGEPIGFAANLMAIVLYNIIGALLGALRDRDQRRLLSLRRAERLAAVGQAVSSVAHDMKTPLMAIGGFASQVRRKLPEGDPGREKLGIVLKQTARLEKMVREMLNFSRPLTLERSEVEPPELLSECLDVTREMAREVGVSLDLAAPDGPHGALWDRDRIQEAVINLLGNAIQASPPGGRVVLELGVRDGQAVVSVRDQGPGVPPERREDILNPFFTTKKDGNGLGLPIVRKIAEAHGGSLEVGDNRPRGAVFSLVLPLDGGSLLSHDDRE